MSKRSNEKAAEEGMMNHQVRPTVAADVAASTPFSEHNQDAKNSKLIPIDQIRPSPYQSRAELDDTYIYELAQSIREAGQLVPVLVREKVSKLDTLDAEGKKVSKLDSWFELIAGHHRLEAVKLIGRQVIPAIIQPMGNEEAARAVAIENTTRSQLSDWELYKHLAMLRNAKAVRNNTDAAKVLHVARQHIYRLETFGALPLDLAGMLDKQPALIGGSLMEAIAPFCASHPAVVIDAIKMLAVGKLKQAGVAGWIERRTMPAASPTGHVRHIKDGASTVKFIIGKGEAKIRGDLDFDKLHTLIEKHLSELKRSPTED